MSTGSDGSERSLQTRAVAADYAFLASAVVLWGLATPLFKYLQSEGCDAITTAFYRTLSSAVFLTLWVLRTQRAELMEALKKPARFIAAGLLFSLGLLAYITGTYENTATLSILLTRATTLLVVVFSCLLFQDERKIALHPYFILGFVLAASGVVGLSLARSSSQEEWHLAAGAGLLLLCALNWSVYSVAVKAWLMRTPPLVASILVFWVSAAVLFPIYLLKGHPGWIQTASPTTLIILVLSGPIVMGLTEAWFYRSVRQVGLTLASTATLLIPFVTAVASWIILDEHPGPGLVLFGALLLSGLALIVLARARAMSGDLRAVVEPPTVKLGAATETSPPEPPALGPSPAREEELQPLPAAAPRNPG